MVHHPWTVVRSRWYLNNHGGPMECCDWQLTTDGGLLDIPQPDPLAVRADLRAQILGILADDARDRRRLIEQRAELAGIGADRPDLARQRGVDVDRAGHEALSQRAHALLERARPEHVGKVFVECHERASRVARGGIDDLMIDV